MDKVKIKLVQSDKLTDKQKKNIKSLQRQVFLDVDEEEAREDFYHKESAVVLAYIKSELVGYAGIHITKVYYLGKKIKLGGYGVGVDQKMRKQGLGTKLVKKAMQYLKNQDCDLAFLSINLTKTWTDKLHIKVGFVHLPQNFSWKNSKGGVKKSNGGMIAPLCSNKIFNLVLNGKETLYVGEGYW